VFGVTGGATGSIEKQIFTFTKSGAVPIGTACIENGIFKLNKSLNKKTYFNSNKKEKASLAPEARKTTNKTTVPILTSVENEKPETQNDCTAPFTEPISINIDTPCIESINIQLANEPELPEPAELTTIRTAFQDFHDDGYYSANSPSSNGEDMDVDLLDLDKDKTDKLFAKTFNTIQINNEPVEYQEFHVDNIIDTDGLNFKLITEDRNTSENSSDCWDDLSSKLIDEERDPSWHPHSFELKKVAVFDNKDLHHALFPEKEKTPVKTRKASTKKPQKYKKGPVQISLEDIDDEEKKKNIIRCREYRCKKNETILEEMTELEKLGARNNELKLQEQALRDKVKKLKDTYIKLISEGTIKFC